jgi:hypothetical protein
MKERAYRIRFFALPFGCFGFSCGSTCASVNTSRLDLETIIKMGGEDTFGV